MVPVRYKISLPKLKIPLIMTTAQVKDELYWGLTLYIKHFGLNMIFSETLQFGLLSMLPHFLLIR